MQAGERTVTPFQLRWASYHIAVCYCTHTSPKMIAMEKLSIFILY